MSMPGDFMLSTTTVPELLRTMVAILDSTTAVGTVVIATPAPSSGHTSTTWALTASTTSVLFTVVALTVTMLTVNAILEVRCHSNSTEALAEDPCLFWGVGHDERI